MEEYNHSPLHTAEQRNRLARRSLIDLAKTPKPKFFSEQAGATVGAAASSDNVNDKDFATPSSSNSNGADGAGAAMPMQTRRRSSSRGRLMGSNKSLTAASPPNGNFRTSSPNVRDAAGAAAAAKDSPHYSLIHPNSPPPGSATSPPPRKARVSKMLAGASGGGGNSSKTSKKMSGAIPPEYNNPVYNEEEDDEDDPVLEPTKVVKRRSPGQPKENDNNKASQDESSANDNESVASHERITTTRRSSPRNRTRPTSPVSSNISRYRTRSALGSEDKIPASDYCGGFVFHHPCYSVIIGILIAAAIVLICRAYFTPALHLNNQISQDRAAGPGANFDRFKRDLERIRDAFPGQDPRTWAVISSQVRRVAVGNAVMPSCIMLNYNTETKDVADCIVAAVGKAVQNLMKPCASKLRHINMAALAREDPSIAKAKIIENISADLQGHHVVVLHGLADLDANPGMALHGICDEGFKLPEDEIKPVVLMTLEVKKEVVDKVGEADGHKQASETIRRRWERDLGIDKVMPLISRIASSVISVKPDTVQRDLCPE